MPHPPTQLSFGPTSPGQEQSKEEEDISTSFILLQLHIEESLVHPRPPGCRCSYVTATASLELQCHFLARNKAGRRSLGTKNNQKDAVSCRYRSTSAATGAHGSLGTEIRITLLPARLGFQFSFAKHWARLMPTISSVIFSSLSSQFPSEPFCSPCRVTASSTHRKHEGMLVKM